RVDHPDGLWNPKQYFERLAGSLAEGAERGAGGDGFRVSTRRLLQRRGYVVAEKILTGKERLPEDWDVDGTTGYDFLNVVNGLFVESRNESAFDRLYGEFTGGEMSFEKAVDLGKKKVLEMSFAA